MTEQPPLDVLHCTMDASSKRSGPLYAQLRGALRQVIDEHFSDGQRFWTENMLIERLGVSQITVRRALLDLAQEGVLERRAAKGSFVRKVSDTTAFDVGCLVPQFDSEFINELLEKLTEVCREREHGLRIHYTHRGENLSDIWRHLATAPRSERFILLGNPSDVTHQLWDTLDDRGYHAVCLDTPAEAPKGRRPAHFVGVDNACGIRLALEHLRDLGHRRVTLLVSEFGEHPNIVARVQAFRELTAAWDWAEAAVVDCGVRPWEDGGQAVWHHMAQVWEKRPTAIVTVSDSAALAALGWLTKHGLSVPKDVSLVGFGNTRSGQLVYPQLTSIGHPYAAMARWSVALLETRSDGPQQLRLEPELVVRHSTGPAALRDANQVPVPPRWQAA